MTKSNYTLCQEFVLGATKGHSGSMSIDGKYLYSYNAEIGRMEAEDGIVYISDRFGGSGGGAYSNTTSSHIYELRRALNRYGWEGRAVYVRGWADKYCHNKIVTRVNPPTYKTFWRCCMAFKESTLFSQNLWVGEYWDDKKQGQIVKMWVDTYFGISQVLRDVNSNPVAVKYVGKVCDVDEKPDCNTCLERFKCWTSNDNVSMQFFTVEGSKHLKESSRHISNRIINKEKAEFIIGKFIDGEV